MNPIIKKAIANGIDTLTDKEYEIYTSEMAKLPKDQLPIVKKAVGNGIDALTDEEYAIYSKPISIQPEVTKPIATIPQAKERDLSAVEAFFPRTSTEGTSFGQKALGFLGDLTSFPGRALGAYATTGEATDVEGAMPRLYPEGQGQSYLNELGRVNGNTYTAVPSQIGQSIIRDPLLIPSIAYGGQIGSALTKSAPYIGEAITPATKIMNQAIQYGKNTLKGVGLGLGETGSRDILDNFTQGKEGMTQGDYVLGGLVGGLVPTAIKASEAVLPYLQKGLPTDLEFLKQLRTRPKESISMQELQDINAPEVVERLNPQYNENVRKEIMRVPVEMRSPSNLPIGNLADLASARITKVPQVMANRFAKLSNPPLDMLSVALERLSPTIQTRIPADFNAITQLPSIHNDPNLQYLRELAGDKKKKK